jgi:hypothetical protein
MCGELSWGRLKMRLGDLAVGFEREVHLIKKVYGEARPAALESGFWQEPMSWSTQSYLVVRLLDEWSLFCRRLIVTSAYGDALTTTGSKLSRSPVLGTLSAFQFLRQSYGQGIPDWEPRWHDTAKALDAAKRLRVSNLAEVAAGLGAVGSAPDDLRRCRNYLAHRSEATDRKVDPVRGRFTPPSLSKTEALGNQLLAGDPLFIGWCADLVSRAHAAAT